MTERIQERIWGTFYPASADGIDPSYHDTLVEVESDGDRVSMHIDVRTEDVQTLELTPEGAWGLIRELARAVSEAERRG